MNFRTTAILSILLAGLVVGYTLLRQSPGQTAGQTETPKPPTSEVAMPLIAEDALGDVEKIGVRTDDGVAWTFAKAEGEAAAGANWNLVEPFSAKASGWEVDRIARDLKSLKYEVSHPAGAPGSISPADAGLEPPQVSVTLTDNEGRSTTVQIGKPASPSETYVRMEGDDRIVVAKSNLRTLIKKSAAEYRDLQLWTFSPENVRRVEIEDRAADGGSQSYAFVRDGARWTMEAPVTARATSKVNDALQAISRLRVAKWHDQREARPAVVGLEPAALTFRVTVEEQVPVEKRSDEAEPASDSGEAQEPPPATELKTKVYELHISKLSPIGEDTKTYVRVGDENAVGTILKTTTDKLKPVMNEWREMRLTTAPVDQANRLEIKVGGEHGVLLKTGEGWKFESGEKADDAEVALLLTSLANLSATAFVEAGQSDPGASGLDSPQADLSLTIPGVEGVERITVGGFTDEASRRLRYARRAADPIAKVRAQDAEELMRPLSHYRDRTVVNVPSSSIERILIRKPSGVGNAETTATFARSGEGWEMVDPVRAPAALDAVNTLANTLSQLRAAAVIGESSDLAAFGLTAPVATVTMTFSAADSTPEGDAAAKSEPIELTFGENSGRTYLKRGDRPAVYEITADVLTQVLGELRSGKVFDFDTAAVSQFSIQQDGTVHTFVRKDSSTWAYGAEPDLPLNSTKVENLLLQIKDIQTPAFVSHAATDLSAFGLDKPVRRITVTTGPGEVLELLVSGMALEVRGTGGTLGGLGAGQPAFLIPEDALRRLQVNLEELEAA